MQKPVKPKRKINKTNLWATIISIIVGLGIFACVIGVLAITIFLKNKPILSLSDFDQTESTIIYDSENNEVANLGKIKRQNVIYEEIPNCVVDAFIAVEDSRFFEHGGFDIPRFSKAMLHDVMVMSFEQGGSTFTMQLCKNTYFTDDDTGQQASRSGASGIRRKIQEISLALELEKDMSKQDIFASYLNKLNYGAYNNIRGIQKSSQFYFGKDVSELNVVEAAMLAGVVNAPYGYNPFNDLQASQDRTAEVLYYMKRHGYITDEEYELYKSVRIEDLLVDPYAANDSGDGIPYQAYIDAVVEEIIDLTGINPYTTPMHVYTYMNKDIQSVMDQAQADTIYVGEVVEGEEPEKYLDYPDDYFECASVCINNATGEVIGILGGRNYARGGELLLNHATEQYKQPGSSIKPILPYALAFEHLGYATDHVITDKPMYMDESHLNLVYNDSGTYEGDKKLYEAVGESINTCAIQTMQASIDKLKYEPIISYCKGLGYDFDLESFNVQYATGGSTCEVTPLQHAAAYAAIMNGGIYNTPHTIKRIEFTNGKDPITPEYESRRVISEEGAYLVTEIMKTNINNYGGSYSVVKNKDYQVYAKTGTTDFGDVAKQYDIPSGSVKDAWLVACTSEYSTATWVGYEQIVRGQPSYINKTYYYTRPQAKIAHLILDEAYEKLKKPTEISKPSGVVSITHILGTWPYASTTVNGAEVAENLITTGLIKKDKVNLVKLDSPTMEYSPKECTVEIQGANSPNAMVSLSWEEYPDEDALLEIGDTKDNSLKDASGNVIIQAEGKVYFDYSWIFGPVRYKADITVKYKDGTPTKTFEVVSDKKDSTQLIGDIRDGADIDVEMYYAYKNSQIKSKEPFKKSFNQGISNIDIKPPTSKDVDGITSWCDKYGITFNPTITNVSTNDKAIRLYDVSNSTYDINSSLTIPASTELTCDYQIYMEITSNSASTVSAGSTVVLTSHLGSSLTSAGEWSYAFPDTFVVTNSGSTLTIEIPAEAQANTYNIKLKSGSFETTYSLSVN